MNITLIQIGKTDASYIAEGIEVYFKRINFYVKFNIVTIPDVKSTRKLTREQQKSREGELILGQLTDSDYVVLLDEGGREFSSVGFSEWVQKRMNAGTRRLCFVIGGPYGFSQGVYDASHDRVSLSRMTFSHQMVRMIFVEQLYRAFSIINGEPYHHV